MVRKIKDKLWYTLFSVLLCYIVAYFKTFNSIKYASTEETCRKLLRSTANLPVMYKFASGNRFLVQLFKRWFWSETLWVRSLNGATFSDTKCIFLCVTAKYVRKALILSHAYVITRKRNEMKKIKFNLWLRDNSRRKKHLKTKVYSWARGHDMKKRENHIRSSLSKK